MLRTHTCGELTKDDDQQEVTLCGWVDRVRDFGGGLFIDLRDRYGQTQVFVDDTSAPEMMEIAGKLRSEFVVSVTGKVRLRPTGQENKKLSTGEIEVLTKELSVLNKAKTPPFVPGQRDLPNEDTRLKHRYIDLRRQQMQDTLVLRSRIIKSMRDYAAQHDFHRRRNPDPWPQHARRCS